jgi:monothiol glutaredoxin
MAEIKEAIQKDIETNKIMLYMKGTPDFPECGFSAKVIEILKGMNAAFETKNVLADPELRQGIKEFSSWPTVPQLYVGGKFIGGCDIVVQMASNGELKKLLDA